MKRLVVALVLLVGGCEPAGKKYERLETQVVAYCHDRPVDSVVAKGRGLTAESAIDSVQRAAITKCALAKRDLKKFMEAR